MCAMLYPIENSRHALSGRVALMACLLYSVMKRAQPVILSLISSECHLVGSFLLLSFMSGTISPCLGHAISVVLLLLAL